LEEGMQARKKTEMGINTFFNEKLNMPIGEKRMSREKG
jgi:hypothetical protein